ncbi:MULTISPECIES: hypothetical protein [Microbacterium]|uniref:Uncharacterized protein n=1 Tax=Microbacterium wangchenii TaxID=2541726 RepID=A0ABX5SXL9_9MICO|nr:MULTISPECIES: hypothetical protein [Microbacterium]MCK6067511.1 hypothetical protein [Microbacterium sp. EYE_512]QBR89559.1 hypothetical protein E4K62_13255 [Microbacterium wangchenii]TFV80901.1 hypothetical protein E4V99_17480 [Microbacterium sp. dk485]TXK16843.1 hypothetical protein FVP99_09260 [Microbacterium wangchenii]
MAFSFVRPESEAWLAHVGSADADPYDATRAVTALRADYERWSRWGMGVLAYALTVVGVFMTLVMTDALLAWTGPVSAVDMIVIMISVGMSGAGAWLLIRLWRTGRQLAAAAAWWIGLPFRGGAAAPSARGWVQARLVNLEPPLFVRLITAALAFLLAVFGTALLFRGILEGEDIALAIAAGLVGLISLVAGCVQAGGVMRIVQGFATADPVWRRVAG